MILKNGRYANSTLISAYGVLKFDDQGILQNDLDEQDLTALSQISGFEQVGIEDVPNDEDAQPESEPEATEEKVEEAPKSKRGAHLNQKK